MLRIEIYQNTESMTFTLAGKLKGPWVLELARCWQTSLPVDSQLLVVDLAAVIFIDDDGKTLLTRMYQSGVRLVATDLLMKAVIEEIESEEARHAAAFCTKDTRREKST